MARPLPGRGPDPRPGRHRGRGALARGRLGRSAAGPAGLLATLHETFGGQANLSLLTADGAVSAYAGNTENPVFTFRLGRIGLASTGIYSLDRSVFRFVAPGATERRLVRVGAHGHAESSTAAPPTRRRMRRPEGPEGRRDPMTHVDHGREADAGQADGSPADRPPHPDFAVLARSDRHRRRRRPLHPEPPELRRHGRPGARSRPDPLPASRSRWRSCRS